MKILVVGALGDIGSEVTRQALADGHEIVALDTIPLDQVTTVDVGHKNLTYVQGNATNFEQLLDIMKESAPDGVITLAAVRTPEDYLVKAHNTNVVITWNVLRGAAEVSCRSPKKSRLQNYRRLASKELHKPRASTLSVRYSM